MSSPGASQSKKNTEQAQVLEVDWGMGELTLLKTGGDSVSEEGILELNLGAKNSNQIVQNTKFLGH